MDDLSPKDSDNDPEFKQLVLNSAREFYEAHKDNPFAAVGYANVIAAMNGEYDKMRPMVDTTPTLRERIVAWWHRRGTR